MDIEYKQEHVISFIFQQLGFKSLNLEDEDMKIQQQKLIFLLQCYGIGVGLWFKWYLGGPYCYELDYIIERIIDRPKEYWLSGIGSHIKNKDAIKQKIDDMMFILGEDKNNILFLQSLSIIVYLRLNGRNASEIEDMLFKIKVRDQINDPHKFFEKLLMISENFIH